jgi:hypothetical protein
MRIEEIVAILSRWFQDSGGAGLKLPSGWFGKPYDNLHQLTAITVLGGRLIIVLDSQMILTLAHPSDVHVENNRIVVSGFTHGTWDWDEHGSAQSHVELLTGGEVEFTRVRDLVEQCREPTRNQR